MLFYVTHDWCPKTGKSPQAFDFVGMLMELNGG
jgi:hypothetical protein